MVNEITPDGKVTHLTTLNSTKRPQAKVEEPVAESKPAEQAPKVEEPAKVQEAPKAEEAPKVESTPSEAKPEPAAAAPPVEFALTSEDEVLLDGYFGAEVREKIVKIYMHILSKPNEKAAAYGNVTSEPILDRELRTKLHQDMRRIFSSKLESSTDKDGYIKIFAAAKQRAPGPRGDMYQTKTPRNQQKGKLGWAELGGEHLHFSLYKENKDTMEVISYVAMRLGMKPRAFSFAGTKDRRGVTVQRVSTFHKNADQLAFLNRDMRGSRIGDFTYEKHGLELGDLTGNEFLITLRDCQFGSGADNLPDSERVAYAQKVVGSAVRSIQKHGFLNYFGLQRFGTYFIGTDEIGRLILKNDFKGAVDAILSFSHECLSAGSNPNFITSDGKPVSRDDIARAQAIAKFRETGKAKEALEKMPRKFSAETAIIRHLERNDRKTDYMGALLSINRNLRLMYVHAYQSLVWNHTCSARWAVAGDKVIAGDLVLIDKGVEKPVVEELDQNGEIVIMPAADDSAVREEDMFERARPLSAEEAASGQFSIFDVVLPTPGYDIVYPENAIGKFYKTFMASERGGELDPHKMRRPQKDFSLSGSYRKVMGTIGKDVSFEVKEYKDESMQFVETDLDKVMKAKAAHVRNPAGEAAYRARVEAAKATVAAATAAEAPAATATPETKDVVMAEATAPGSMTGEKRAAEEKVSKEEEKKSKIAVIVKLQLGSSQYATMALRELMKEGGVVTYKPDFSSGR